MFKLIHQHPQVQQGEGTSLAPNVVATPNTVKLLLQEKDTVQEKHSASLLTQTIATGEEST